MKYMIVYQYPSDKSRYVVGFANSIEEFIKANNKKTYPYRYEVENLKLVELTTDVFSIASIEGQSNFKDYLKFAQ